jgi:hypothetical protein
VIRDLIHRVNLVLSCFVCSSIYKNSSTCDCHPLLCLENELENSLFHQSSTVLHGQKNKLEGVLSLLLKSLPLQGLYRHQQDPKNNQSKPGSLRTRHQDLVKILKKHSLSLLFQYQISLHLRKVKGERYEIYTS